MTIETCDHEEALMEMFAYMGLDPTQEDRLRYSRNGNHPCWRRSECVGGLFVIYLTYYP